MDPRIHLGFFPEKKKKKTQGHKKQTKKEKIENTLNTFHTRSSFSLVFPKIFFFYRNFCRLLFFASIIILPIFHLFILFFILLFIQVKYRRPVSLHVGCTMRDLMKKKKKGQHEGEKGILGGGFQKMTSC